MDDPMSLDSAIADRATLVQPRALVALLLILAGVVWAIARGLTFYGVSPVSLGYDLDQPPLLVLLVGAWLFYRARPPRSLRQQ